MDRFKKLLKEEILDSLGSYTASLYFELEKMATEDQTKTNKGSDR